MAANVMYYVMGKSASFLRTVLPDLQVDLKMRENFPIY